MGMFGGCTNIIRRHSRCSCGEPGEKPLEKEPFIIGDKGSDRPEAANWRILFRRGPNDSFIIAIAASEVGLKTNLGIFTNKRIYMIGLTSYAKPAMEMVKWTYPDSSPASGSIALASRDNSLPSGLNYGTVVPAKSSSENCDPLRLNMDYSIKVSHGETPNWLPLSAYDCGGTMTYIKFPADIGRVSAPALFIVNRDGGLEPQTIVAAQNFYKIDRSFTAAELRIGSTVVSVTKTQKK